MDTARMSPSPTFALASSLVDEVVALSPVTATYLGVASGQDRWDDLSPDGAVAELALWRDARRRIEALRDQPSPLSEPDALALEVMLDHAALRIDSLEQGDHQVDLNSISSTLQTVLRSFHTMPSQTEADWAAITRRLETLDEPLRGYQARLDEGRRQGRAVARRQVEAALAQARLESGPRSDFFRVAAGYDRANPALAAALDAAVHRARAAVASLATYLEQTYLPDASEREAVGPERYRRAAREHLGMDLDLAETYAWGWEEIRTIEAEMEQIAAELGRGATAAETIAALKRDPAQRAPTTEIFIARMAERQQTALSALDGASFDVPPPARRIDVFVAPPGGPIGAYYSAPSEDFSRPGAVWYSLESPTDIPCFSEITTAHHEGFPGHHLHISTQLYQSERLSRFQRLIAHGTGHAEGWALYAERLMRELGFLERPEYVLGLLMAELVRAWRVVVDIGLHLELPIPASSSFHPGEIWRYELAIEALRDRAFLAPGAATSNAVRYLGWPAQAISYKVGQRVVLDLRDQRRRLDGESFNLKSFHARLVGVGAVGLDLLRRLTLA